MQKSISLRNLSCIVTQAIKQRPNVVFERVIAFGISLFEYTLRRPEYCSSQSFYSQQTIPNTECNSVGVHSNAEPHTKKEGKAGSINPACRTQIDKAFSTSGCSTSRGRFRARFPFCVPCSRSESLAFLIRCTTGCCMLG